MSVMQDHSIRAGKFDEAYLRTPLLFLLLGYVVGQRFSSVTGYIQNHHFFGIVYIQVIQKIYKALINRKQAGHFHLPNILLHLIRNNIMLHLIQDKILLHLGREVVKNTFFYGQADYKG